MTKDPIRQYPIEKAALSVLILLCIRPALFLRTTRLSITKIGAQSQGKVSGLSEKGCLCATCLAKIGDRIEQLCVHNDVRRSSGSMEAKDEGDAGGSSERYYCPYPNCKRSFAELWRLKVHYR